MNSGNNGLERLVVLSRRIVLFVFGVFFLVSPEAFTAQTRFNSELRIDTKSVQQATSVAQNPKFVSILDPSLRKQSLNLPFNSLLGIKPVYKSSGKEFYLIFLASVGSQAPWDPPYKRIFISARSHVKGKVSLMSGSWEQSFVTNAMGLIQIDLPAWAEMTSLETEVIIPKVFKIESEDEIAVYGLSHKNLSTDGFLVLPIESLGLNYSVASIRNALYYFGGRVNSWVLNGVNPRSEFGIAAIADTTIVTITTTSNSFGGRFQRGVPYTLKLNKGEAMQIMARDTALIGLFDTLPSWIGPLPNGIDCDMTGSTISSNKPIAVFSGHERASVPDSIEYLYNNHPSVSRDHLIEQMPPVENWGKHFAVVPSVQDSYGKRPKDGDLVRVISAFDSTNVWVNGKLISRVDKGAYTQFPVNRVVYIETSQPALTVKYLRTALPDSTAPGDPDLTVVPPLENMSSFYSLPTVADGANFTEHYITIYADTLALGSTTLNGFTLNQGVFKPIPGSRYYYTTQRTYAGSQRVESSLPCYAESYGYGIFDSYSFSGGGSFKLIHDLKAKDLDFGKVTTGDSRDSVTGVQSVSIPMPLGDSVTIFRYSWESGDTTAFTLLDTIKKPIIMAPGDLLRVNFKFSPKVDGYFRARMRVWSTNTDDVFINVMGTAGTPKISVYPDTIEFHGVRVGRKRDSIFYIANVSPTEDLILSDVFFNGYLLPGPFSANTYPFSRTLVPSEVKYDSVHFQPKIRGYFQDTIFVTSDAGTMPTVVLRGRGINYDVSTQGVAFGKIRVGLRSAYQDISVSNFGDDTTSVVSIAFAPDGNPQDFELDNTTLPSNPITDWELDTLKSKKNMKSFRARFAPILQLPSVIDTGFKYAIVKIVTSEGKVFFDTLTGTGVEPWLVAIPLVLDFGTITNPSTSSSPILSLYDTIFNQGTIDGILQSLSHINTNYFSLRGLGGALVPNTTIAESTTLPFAVDFKVNRIGDFYDTIYANNDSRNVPLVIVRAKVRAGIDQFFPISLGQISTCMPIDTTIIIHNPYRVQLALSAFRFEGDTAGFEIRDASHLNLPVFIDGDSIFSLHIRYVFPADSLNGTQTVRLIITRPTGGDDLGLNYDTITISLSRKTKLLTLRVDIPTSHPSAGDQPFKIPVRILGDHFAKPELDNDTVKIIFSNKLIQPVGIDRSASLTQSQPGIIPEQPTWIWDEPTSTMLVPCQGLTISSDKSSNNLLFTILCNTFLTKDTTITITPLIGYIDQPCAYRVARDTGGILYANECGDQTIRGLLLKTGVPLVLSAPMPDPVSIGTNSVIRYAYIAAGDYYLSWKLFDPLGILVLRGPEIMIKGGEGDFSIPMKQISVSGAHYLEVTVRDEKSGSQSVVSSKFTVIK